jgi:hypothetical protein
MRGRVGFEPTTCSARSEAALTGVTAFSLPPKLILGETRRSSLEPFRSTTCAVNGRSFLQPWFADQARDSIWSEVASPSLPRKRIRHGVFGATAVLRCTRRIRRAQRSRPTSRQKMEPLAGCAPASQRYEGCASLSTLKRRNEIDRDGRICTFTGWFLKPVPLLLGYIPMIRFAEAKRSKECRRQALHLHFQRSRRCASSIGLRRQKSLAAGDGFAPPSDSL